MIKAIVVQEDAEDQEESEIDGEDRAHDKVNMIPNSQVYRAPAPGMQPGLGVEPLLGDATEYTMKEVSSDPSNNK